MNIWEKMINYFTELGISRGLAITYIIVSALIVIMAVLVVVMRIYLIFAYQKGNKQETHSGKTSNEVARDALDKAGLQHIQVKKAGLLRAFVYGNCYSITKKTIFLRRGIYNKNSITAVAMALQKVGVAKMCESGDVKTRTRNTMQILSLFGPLLFIPFAVLGFAIDYLLFNSIGVFSAIGLAMAWILVIAGFVATMLNLPVEKKANNVAIEIIKKTGVLTEDEIAVVKKVFKAYIVSYVCEFIVAVLRIVQIVLEIIMNSQIKKN